MTIPQMRKAIAAAIVTAAASYLAKHGVSIDDLGLRDVALTVVSLIVGGVLVYAIPNDAVDGN